MRSIRLPRARARIILEVEMGWSFTEVEIVAGLFVLTGCVLVAALHFLVRSSPPPPVETPSVSRSVPSPLASVRDEGFQVIELYEDSEPFERSPQAGVADGLRPRVCTAKVLDPESGQIRLLRVVLRHKARR